MSLIVLMLVTVIAWWLSLFVDAFPGLLWDWIYWPRWIIWIVLLSLVAWCMEDQQ
ncbi:hypothetical protein S7335_2753 [Synechococcus sp. PCC 7335]|uniref:hypothetical protein n=1 Tax=Synechococcus sp. (strain ATCC 29403 / PCC 7335) TaxID=91464 RepID=UPI00017EB4AE|nr:hypothetical protein [Synechococcus sp. PCC 7335]EDX85054.1 hypothetical protein S7335_2753 [Synechococcus sp. PCC 7335]